MTAQQIIGWLKEHVARTAHLCLDSRQVARGDVFFACPGLADDGRQYIRDAIARGAAAIVVQAGDGAVLEQSAPMLEIQGLQALLGSIAHAWYEEPSSVMSVIAVTGTNGKTTTVQWIAAALNLEGVPCGTVGTLGVTLPNGANLGGALTTPDVLTLHRSLAAIRDAGGKAVALEASSIGIEQGRLDHVHIEIAGFTNLTRDHLDYHQTLENYKAAKFALFGWPALRAAIVNVDDAAGKELYASVAVSDRLGYSLKRDSAAAVQAQDVQTGSYGLIFNLLMPDGAAQIVTRLVGEHNISNLLLVAGVLRELGWGLARIARVLVTLRSVEGRLQVVEPCDGGDASIATPLVVVDYAHTPDALERALQSLREVARVRNGRLVCVFGCGGSRDSGKRPIMGGIAGKLADSVILTNDNPRAEDPHAIVDQIVAGMPARPQIELDRASAILAAIWGAKPNDVVLLAGKGHETYQEFKNTRIPFDDREWARFAVTWLRGMTVSTDSRSILPGQIFVALKGESFDGHRYLAQVQLAGACAAIVSRRDTNITLPQFELGDTRAALIKAGSAWRRQFHLPAIAVTGSNGKTTTKEMVAAILLAWVGAEASLSTAGNLNNDIGVPLTLLRLRPSHSAAVFELGMNHPGEIAGLADMAQATVALVNNAQREHQEFMHSVEAVAIENGAVLSALPDDGVAVFPGDDLYTPVWKRLAGERKTLLFGFEPHFDVYADQIHAEARGTQCQLHTPVGVAALTLAAPGVHNLRNALAAAACACAAGAPLVAIVEGLARFNPVAGRMQPYLLADGRQLIDDSYNANPDSVRAAIDVLARLDGKKILVLGDMAEVGENGPAMHAEVGAYAREQTIDELLTFGPAARNSAAAFGGTVRAFDSIEALVADLLELLPANILVKGSRSTRMERVVQALQKQLKQQESEARHAT
ncbi:bifunctional UDP-N-acetylmuramoyl-L-alanyl-D-glutamate--2,6-diaminopimelate ligase MurE/UDP-N-acetylmuramoyl-tripeptide--D-alanyl-D-alanine ligase MurF [Paralcaligenes sp. KSB-10]|uniref:bifunctional UDP-N-acetylmuramoyl-L-alanyl-D-glutamate--2, 6-diaminopimelate ligase MurE/UDP-N-acetylmuramoyl-tripeptide--D-alanyl-D-alanine ligase MurF n=1 Tax=Paralcaligenes sp. KSB-10 TaxID=2901142 RepID=UPI001E59F042|nr:bifunctional UDP-N-acetylmuramoyl-L-alanyl-D-glutamate--2,6-diaminopimelate ligase MurE/UDP-N-acetylmuramoyl-tripeptide--D-alanyl-D-alanine ligase MurF [Paralcaligenes sp. KSB-10]UHL65824.1 bifunctional UDP-N-acetylmuramoyl-L-alanyl-D-glutamate--2,6-diaminopimelate ligase MurE/UDP-N-acetylmuramoyl-tripeptide--D-alanyl-D-alanine ligase MurF [Paralcaligenes sp. KSB-10]